MSAINIPDMSVVMRHNGLVPVPFDIDVDTGAPRLDEVERLLQHYGTLGGGESERGNVCSSPSSIAAAAATTAPNSAAPRSPPRVAFVLVAHLYGRRFDMAPVLALCARYGGSVGGGDGSGTGGQQASASLPVVEDLAEAFAGMEYTGHPGSDLALFSFGSIKVMRSSDIQVSAARGICYFGNGRGSNSLMSSTRASLSFSSQHVL